MSAIRAISSAYISKTIPTELAKEMPVQCEFFFQLFLQFIDEYNEKSRANKTTLSYSQFTKEIL